MPTTVTNTIGTGGNYTTVAAWNSAAPSNLVTANEIWEGLLLDQSFTAQTITISGSTTSTTCYKQLACNPGASFRDNASVRSNALQFNTANGAAISGGTHYVPCLQVSEANFHLFGVQIAATSAVQNTISASGVTGVIIDSCIVESFSGSGAPPLNIDEGVIKNSLLVVRGSGAGAIAQVQGNSAFYNCTLVVPSDLTAASLGIQVKYPTGTTIVENTVICNATTAYSSTGTSTITTCATDQASPPTGFTTVTYNSSLFEATTDASRDFRLPTGSALIGAATADTTNAATDISGLARPQGSSWDIGAWEYQAPSGGAALAATPSDTTTATGSMAAALAAAPSDTTSATGSLGHRHVVANLVQESTTTTGTSPFSLGGALTGFQSFGTVMNDQDTCLYLAQAVTSGAPNGPWEIGIGTYNLSTNSLSRTQVLKSSNSNAAVSFAAGTTNVSLTEPAEALWNKGVFNAGNSGSAITIDWSRGPYQMVTLTAACTITFVNSMLCPHGVLELYQDAIGGRVPTLTGAVYRSGSPPSWSTTNATHDTLEVDYNAVMGASNVFLKT